MLSPGVLTSAMQNYKYDKAIVAESKNGGSPALNNNPRKGGSKRVLLICLDLFCLFMGEPGPTVPRALGARRASQPDSGCARGGVSRPCRAVSLGGPCRLLGEPSRCSRPRGPRPLGSRRLPGL